MLSCEHATWFLIIHSNKTQLLESLHGALSFCLFFSFFSFFQVFSEYGYLSKESLEFPELVCLNKHQNDFCFCTKLWIPKKTLEEKGNTLKDSWCSGFVSKYCAQSVIYMKQQKKWKHVMNTGKHLILLTRRLFWQRKSCCIMSQVTNKTETS